MDKSKQILRQVNALLKQIKLSERDFQRAILSENDGLNKLEQRVASWSEFYSLSFLELLALFSYIAGAIPTLEKAASQKHSYEAKLTFLGEMQNFEPSIEHLTEFMDQNSAEKLAIQTFFALHYSMKALAHRNRPINTMLEQIRAKVDNYEDIIFEAISIDASVVGNSEIAGFIARWVISGNKDKLGKLSKAIVGKYPRGKRTVGLDDYRFMVVILEELDGEATSEAIYEMNQYLNLIAEGDDLESAIKKHLQTRKKDTRKSKAQTTS